jgi:RNA polymerase sigma-70 factor (ECF subfamily)
MLFHLSPRSWRKEWFVVSELPAAIREAKTQTLHGEAELIARAKVGDEAAARALIQSNNRRIYRVARSILRDDSEAEDVVQETYLRAFAALSTFRQEAGFSTWLTRIALNEALERLRRRRLLPGLDETRSEVLDARSRVIPFPLAHPPSPEADFGRRQVRDLLEAAIDKLPDPFRLVFILRDVEEMSIEETARHLSLKPQTVKTRLHRARRLLRQALDEQLTSAFTDLFPFGGKRCQDMTNRVMSQLRNVVGDARA